MRRRGHRQRPEGFEVDLSNPLFQGAVFLGLGRSPGSTHFHDSSGRDNHGTLTAMAPATKWLWSDTLNRRVLEFVANGDYVDLGAQSPPSLDAQQLTVACWCKTDDYTNSINGGIARGRAMDAATGYSWELYWNSSNARFSVADNTDTNRSSGDVGIGDNNWHHWAGVFSGTRVSLYKDGVEASGADWSGAIDYTKVYNYARIGWGFAGTTACLDGQLGDVSVWNRPLSPSEIAALADPSNVMLGGAIVGPRRRWIVVGAGGAPPPTGKGGRLSLLGVA